MAHPDLNLLVTLDVLLREGSVARAARKLQLSPSAMSRALARLRDVTGDPLLVRAGRGLVPTPRAAELGEHVRQLVQDAQAVLRPAKLLNLQALRRTFTLRSSDGFAETFGPALLRKVQEEAPGVTLRLLRKLDKDSGSLRDGSIDLETGVIGKATGPELRTLPLFRDSFVGVVRPGHELSKRPVTLAVFLNGRHVAVSRDGSRGGLIDKALEAAGGGRDVAAVVDGYSAALALAGATDMIATVPARHTSPLRAGLHSFALPFEVPDLMISLLWHPRQDGDPAHRWLRRCVQAACSTGSDEGVPERPPLSASKA